MKAKYAILCDEVRREDNGKLFALGIYSSVVEFFNFPAQKGFCFLAALDSGEAGEYALVFQMLVDGVVSGEGKGTIEVINPGLDLFPVPFPPINIPGPSVIKFRVKINRGRWTTLLEKPIRLRASPTV